MYSPLPGSPASSYNQDLIIPLADEEEEYNPNENDVRSTGNYRTTAQENVYQKTDFIPQEDEIPPLQPRNAQVSDQNHVFQNNQNNLGQMIIVRQEDNVFDQSEVYHNPPQAMDNDVIFDSPSPHHQENSSTFYPDYQEPFTRNTQNNKPIVYDLPYRGESSSSHPIQNQMVQNTQQEDNCFNLSETFRNSPQAINNDTFYDSSSQHHQENSNIDFLDDNNFLQEENSMSGPNSTPFVNESSYRGEPSSSHSNQHQTVQNTQNNFGQMRTVQQVHNPSIVANPAGMYSNRQQTMNTNVFYGAMSQPHQENRRIPILNYNDTLQGTNSMNVNNSTPIVHELPYHGESSSSHPIQIQPIQSGRRAPKRQYVETPDDHNGKYKEFYDIQEMNTKEVCQALIMKLNKLKIYRTVFAEKVLERQQGTSSDLLNKPKPWEKITAGRDTYRRMYMFLKLSDEEMKRIETMSVAEVQQMMNFPPTTKTERKTSQTDGNNENEEPKAKCQRIEFNSYQKQTFEDIFKQIRYPPRETMEALAVHLQLPIKSVKNWFMNARRREKTNDNTSTLSY